MADVRKYPRYPAKRGALASLFTPLEIACERRLILSRIGELVDLGEGGLAFICNADGKPYTGPGEVEVFGFEPPECSIGRVPCRVVYEKTIEEFPESSTETRRCGLEFAPSLREAAERRRAFIAANTISSG
jgi:hypothetical protein